MRNSDRLRRGLQAVVRAHRHNVAADEARRIEVVAPRNVVIADNVGNCGANRSVSASHTVRVTADGPHTGETRAERHATAAADPPASSANEARR